MKGPWRLTFDTNPDDCNYHCIMCEEFSVYNNSKQNQLNSSTPIRKRRMEFGLIKKVLDDVMQYGSLKEIIPSTMGEPLLYSHFEKIIDLCKHYNLQLNLTTNGSFPRKSVEDWANLLCPITSDIKVSWNGATKETQEKIMRNSNYEDNFRKLQKLIKIRDIVSNSGKNRCQITLQITFMEENYEEFPDLVKIAAELGIDRIKGHHLWIHFDELQQQSMRRNSNSINNWNSIVKKMKANSEKYRKSNGDKVKLENIFILDIGSSEELIFPSVCPFLGEEAWIAWDGRFNPCCAPDLLRKELGVFGNLITQTFSEIWESKTYQNLVANYNKYSLCKNCNMRKPVTTENEKH